MRLTNEKKELVAKLTERFGTTTLTRKQIVEFYGGEKTLSGIRWLLNSKKYRVGRGLYDLNLVTALATSQQVPNQAAVVGTTVNVVTE